MNYNKIGEKIRYIREKELKQTREEFAEEIGISIHTVARLENATSKVSSIEFFIKISEISGYTLDELIFEENCSKNKNKLKRKITYQLDKFTTTELEYIYNNIKDFKQFINNSNKIN